MAKWAYRFSFKNPRIAAIVFGSFTIIQFSVETLFFICFAVYAATPISTVTKVFYAFAAIVTPFFLVLSILFVYSVSQDEHRWMIPWLVCYGIVAIAEVVFSVIAFILLNDFHEIFHFYSTAWRLAEFQRANQLLIGTTASCQPVSSAMLSSSADGVRFAALFSQQGAQGVIAFFVLAILLKNAYNLMVMIAGVQAYREIRDGEGRPSTLSPNRSKFYYHDPHLRQNRKPFTSINTISR